MLTLTPTRITTAAEVAVVAGIRQAMDARGRCRARGKDAAPEVHEILSTACAAAGLLLQEDHR